jgi:hypothetical protein
LWKAKLSNVAIKSQHVEVKPFLFKTNSLLTAKTQRAQRRWFFVLAVRGRHKSGDVFTAAAENAKNYSSLSGHLSRPDKRKDLPSALFASLR